MRRSRKAVATVATSEARIAEAQRDAAEARKETEKERLARVKIEEALAGWKLSTEGRERIKQKMARFSGTPFDLFVNPAEATFMEALDGALADAGWKRQEPKNMSILFAKKAGIIFASGITLEFALDRWRVFEPAVTALAEALNAEGIPAHRNAPSTGSDPSAIHIVIGRRI